MGLKTTTPKQTNKQTLFTLGLFTQGPEITHQVDWVLKANYLLTYYLLTLGPFTLGPFTQKLFTLGPFRLGPFTLGPFTMGLFT